LVLHTTARKAVYQQRTPLTGFTELELPNFRLQDIREFVYRWFDYQTNLQKRKKTEDPDSMLACNPRIQILATNPLLLSLITTEYEAQRDLPNRRTELYQDCIDILLATWDSIRDIHRSSEFQTEHKRSLLEAVAWHLHINGRCYFSEGELLTVITGYLLREGLSSSDTRQILEAIVTENGLLKEYARGWYGFLYLTLQEYFVAKYAVNHNQLDTLLAHVGDPWWEEVISLYAGCIPDASSLLQKLLEQDKGSLLQEDIFYSNLILAGRCLATSSAVQQVSLRETVISHLFEVLTTTSYSLIQQRIVFILTEIGRTDVNARLQDLLSNQQVPPFVRWCIADLLNAQIPELASPSELQKHLYGSTYTFFDERIKGFSPFILLDIQQTDSTLLNRLEKALRLRDEQSLAVDLQSLFSNWRIDKYVRKHIAERLGLLGEQFLTRPLLQSLSDEQIHPQVRASIAFALGQIGDRSVSPTLLQLLLNEHIDLGLRTSIVFALGRLGERSVVNDLLQLLFNTKVNLDIRLDIAYVLGDLGERSVVPKLLELLSAPQVSKPQFDRTMRERIIKSLGQLANDESTVRKLIPLLQNSDLTDEVYYALWKISRRARVRIFMTDGPADKQIEVIKQGTDAASADKFITK
jgi:hypothetical protein